METSLNYKGYIKDMITKQILTKMRIKSNQSITHDLKTLSIYENIITCDTNETTNE